MTIARLVYMPLKMFEPLFSTAGFKIRAGIARCTYRLTAIRDYQTNFIWEETSNAAAIKAYRFIVFDISYK